MKKPKGYMIPHYCKVIIEGRAKDDEPWALRNAFKDENAAVFGGEMEPEKLWDKANRMAEDWRRNYPNAGKVRVTVCS